MKNVKPHRQYLLILLKLFNLLILVITVTSCTNARKSTNANNNSLFLIMSYDEETDEILKKNHLESRIVFKHNSLDSFKFDSINVTHVRRRLYLLVSGCGFPTGFSYFPARRMSPTTSYWHSISRWTSSPLVVSLAYARHYIAYWE